MKMKETLSPKQAAAICEEINAIMSSCKVRMENKNREFAEAVSKIWEDRNAVDCFKKHKQNMEDAINKLNQNNKTFINTVKDIANSYSSVGGMDKIEAEAVTLVPNIDVSQVQEHFEDGNGDDFGFVNPRNGVAQVMDAFDTLKNDLEQIADETQTRIHSINAFGNPNIQMELAKSAGKVVEILEDHVSQAREIMHEFLEKTARAYIEAGENANDVLNGLNGDDEVPPPTVQVPAPQGPTYPAEGGEPVCGNPPSSTEGHGHGPGGHESEGHGEGPGGHAPSHGHGPGEHGTDGHGHGPGGHESDGHGHGPGGHAPSGGSGYAPGGNAPTGGIGGEGWSGGTSGGSPTGGTGGEGWYGESSGGSGSAPGGNAPSQGGSAHGY